MRVFVLTYTRPARRRASVRGYFAALTRASKPETEPLLMTLRRFAPQLVSLEPRQLLSAVQPPTPPGQFFPGFTPGPVMDPSFDPTLGPTGPGTAPPAGPAGTDLPPSSPLSPPPTLLC